jgi:hypothetical protein
MSIFPLVRSHHVSRPRLNVDYYQDFEAPQGYLTETYVSDISGCLYKGP